MGTEIETDRSTDKEREWPIWVGSMEDVRRLATATEQMAEIRRRFLLESFDEETEQEVGVAPNRLGSKQLDVLAETDSEGVEFAKELIRQNVKGLREAERRGLEKRLTVTATLVDGDDTTKGEIASVLAELDRRSVKSVEFSMWHYDERVAVTLDRKAGRLRGYGARLQVKSSDLGWARQTFAHLSDEISKGEPKYSWIRKTSGRIAVVCGWALAPILAIVLIVLPSVPGKDRWVPWLVGIYAALALAFIIALSDSLLDWLAPRFEIVGEDGQSTGRRRIGAAIAPVVAVIIGIIVNRIYP